VLETSLEQHWKRADVTAGTYVAGGITVVEKYEEHWDIWLLKAAVPKAVPVTALAQLSALHPTRRSRATLKTAGAMLERTIRNDFMVG
jgi:hypothetical protein